MNTLNLINRHRILGQHMLNQLPSQPSRIGIGTGKTMLAFIQQIPEELFEKHQWVASSTVTEKALSSAGIVCQSLNETGSLDLYIDSTDWLCPYTWQCLKGGGGAMTIEKICASAARQFICLATIEKYRPDRHGVAIALEVLPIARAQVARLLIKNGITAQLRENTYTDSGNLIIDVYNATQRTLSEYELWLNSLPGVVDNGIFSLYRPHQAYIINPQGEVMYYQNSL